MCVQLSPGSSTVISVSGQVEPSCPGLKSSGVNGEETETFTASEPAFVTVTVLVCDVLNCCLPKFRLCVSARSTGPATAAGAKTSNPSTVDRTAKLLELSRAPSFGSAFSHD